MRLRNPVRQGLLCLLAVLHETALGSSQHANSEQNSIGVGRNDHENFDYFAIKITPTVVAGGGDVIRKEVRRLADTLGYHALGQVGELNNYYLFASSKGVLSERDSDNHHVVRRFFEHTDIVESVKLQVPEQRLFRRSAIPADTRAGPVRLEELRKQLNISDPGLSRQWHIVNSEVIGNDLNVAPVWTQGITGKNVTVCFVDDGLDYTNEDLKDNFYLEGSWDFNARPQRQHPTPTDPADRHGTRCAGEVAAVRNDVCGVGVAYDAKVSGVRILSGDLTEVDEAASINFDFQNNHIYSCSWGPSDNGRSMEAPPAIVQDAVVNGITNGRHGLGSIYVFASGNGGSYGDNCNYDGYTNSIYTVTVAAIDRHNKHPTYSEACSAVMIVMYSSSGQSADAIYTSDWPGQCTESHGGTSAAAPLASGVYALAIQIRPDLTWRDIQHLSVRTAVPISLDDPDWEKTPAGYLYSNKFGFGKLDALAYVEAAKTWKTVSPQTQYQSPLKHVDQDIPNPGTVESSVVVTAEDVAAQKLAILEHVTVTITLTHQRRADLDIWLTSPMGTRSQIAAPRSGDSAASGMQNWTFMTVKHWDENPIGTWTLTISDVGNPKTSGKMSYWWINLFGSDNSQKLNSPTTVGTLPATSAGASTSSTTPSTTSSTITTPTTISTSTTIAGGVPTHVTGSSVAPVSTTSAGLATLKPIPTIISGQGGSRFTLITVAAVLLVVAGVGVWFFRRRTAGEKSGAGNYGVLNDTEVDAAFEDYELEGDGNREIVFDRFVLPDMDDDSEPE